MNNKRIIIALFLVVCMASALLLSSCTESEPTVIETVQKDPTAFTKTTLEKTLQALSATSTAYRSAKELSNDGTLELNLATPDVAATLKAYCKGENSVIVLELPDEIELPDEMSASVYVSKDSLTIDLSKAMPEGKIITISKDSFKDLISAAVMQAQAAASEAAEGNNADVAAVMDIVKKAVELVKPTVTEEAVTVSGKSIDCISVTYNIDEGVLKTVLSSILNGLKDKNLITEDQIKELFEGLIGSLSSGALPTSGTGIDLGSILGDAGNIEIDTSKLFNAEYIINLLKTAGFSFKSLSAKTCTSKEDGWLVYADFDAKVEIAGKENFVSLKADLGANASLYEDKTITASFDIASVSGTATIAWNAEDSDDKLTFSLKADASISMSVYGTENNMNLDILDITLDYAKDTGAYILSGTSGLLPLIAAMDGGIAGLGDDVSPEIFTITGIFKYSNELIEFNVGSIKAMGQEIGSDIFNLTASFKPGAVLPATPEGQKINNIDELTAALGLDSLGDIVE